MKIERIYFHCELDMSFVEPSDGMLDFQKYWLDKGWVVVVNLGYQLD